MLANPEAQKKVHEELDTAIGAGQAPSMAEIQKLDYFNAAWKESKRWNTPAPLGQRMLIHHDSF
jgi:cytochrome P450